MQLKSTVGSRAMLSCFIIKRAKHYAPNWFNYLIVCSFWAKSGMRGKLQLLQTSVLYKSYFCRNSTGVHYNSVCLYFSVLSFHSLSY